MNQQIENFETNDVIKGLYNKMDSINDVKEKTLSNLISATTKSLNEYKTIYNADEFNTDELDVACNNILEDIETINVIIKFIQTAINDKVFIGEYQIQLTKWLKELTTNLKVWKATKDKMDNEYIAIGPENFK